MKAQVTDQAFQAAERTFNREAEAIAAAGKNLKPSVLSSALECILSHNGKIVITGVGKSGHVARKIAGTLTSTGTQAIFLHPCEAVHGDLGIYCPGDPTIMISKSGATAELVRLLPVLKSFQSPLIGIFGNRNGPLSKEVDYFFDATITREADPLNLAPTSSAIVSMAIGDALASALITARRFTNEHFAEYHPAGQLGKGLLTKVSEIMHRMSTVAVIQKEDNLREVVIKMTEYPLGLGCVLDEEGRLQGVITDGDIRRALRNGAILEETMAEALMTKDPIVVFESDTLQHASSRMEERPSQISALPVLNPDGICAGVVRIHDVYQVKID